MVREYSISVAMATYNGEKYIRGQLDSIIKQLNDIDEIIISDDGSTDETINIINSYKDKRIKLIYGPKKGVKQNFANAIKKCTGKYVFLSDQDDIWMDDKVEKVLKCFDENKCTCVLHDNVVLNSDTDEIIHDSFFKWRKSKTGYFNNIWKNSYIGCCMAFDSSLKNKILPIPNDIEMHDQWIGIINDKYGKSVLLDNRLIIYRRHGNNVSQMSHYGFLKMLKNRLILIFRMVVK